jgi:hypothetical protein
MFAGLGIRNSGVGKTWPSFRGRRGFAAAEPGIHFDFRGKQQDQKMDSGSRLCRSRNDDWRYLGCIRIAPSSRITLPFK